MQQASVFGKLFKTKVIVFRKNCQILLYFLTRGETFELCRNFFGNERKITRCKVPGRRHFVAIAENSPTQTGARADCCRKAKTLVIF